MRTIERVIFCLALPLTATPGLAQQPGPPLSNLSATRTSPLYTTYAADRERSEFVLDQGYHFVYYDPSRGLEFTTDQAGDLGLAFQVGERVVKELRDFTEQPTITASYSDLVRYWFRPLPELRVEATFVVYSSRLAVHELRLRNTGSGRLELELIALLRKRAGSFTDTRMNTAPGAISFAHEEPPDPWTVEHGVPAPGKVRDVFLMVATPERVGGDDDSLALRKRIVLPPGRPTTVRIVRGVARMNEPLLPLVRQARALAERDLSGIIRASERAYSRVRVPRTTDPDRQLLYWSAFSLMRQLMLPAEGNARHNYYVFSREPTWGWGHGGQVFHESLTMLAYAHLDPQGAMDSQRLFADRQHIEGYIPYRIGPYLEETIPHNSQLTTSAPWYAWQNWEVYRVTRDTAFLRQMYSSSRRFFDHVTRNRDADGDGLYEWGGHAVLESVRDGEVAVWDQVAWPGEFEALDLNTMLAQEAQALAEMANELGRDDEARAWSERASALRDRINQAFWDEGTGFYYHVDRRDHDFTHTKPNDLKRQEIIGFLPLWAGVATPERAARLVRVLTDSAKFWRRNGVPSLAADDPYYNPHGYWNGPVWVQWNYLIQRGLLRSGYQRDARELVDRVA
ncbi:MAG TPA: trehalase family glycosidase, partial [Longimicrobiales bacterium]|nr:trehalase family glycosidase [Longimicrobiales bacterium]